MCVLWARRAGVQFVFFGATIDAHRHVLRCDKNLNPGDLFGAVELFEESNRYERN